MISLVGGTYNRDKEGDCQMKRELLQGKGLGDEVGGVLGHDADPGRGLWRVCTGRWGSVLACC